MNPTLPDLCVVDTNVPLTANRAVTPDEIPDDLVHCVIASLASLRQIMAKRNIVIDDHDAICSEYRHKLNMKGQPGVGDRFVKWIHDHAWELPAQNRVHITPTPDGTSYLEFPAHPGLRNFDPSDRKFIAVANALPTKAGILQATDSKWWGWKDALAACNIEVCFMDEEYCRNTYHRKGLDE